MKGLYQAILDFFGEIEEDMSMDNSTAPFALDSAKESVNYVVLVFLFRIYFPWKKDRVKVPINSKLALPRGFRWRP